MNRKYFDGYGSRSSLYNTWSHMKDRCYNPAFIQYKDYGGRGITICDEWRRSFVAFKEWALANGYSEGLTIDRINNNGNYEPLNCRWATRKMQANNRRNTYFITYNGETRTLTEWANVTGIKLTTLHMRLRAYGWSVERSLTEGQKRGVMTCA